MFFRTNSTSPILAILFLAVSSFPAVGQKTVRFDAPKLVMVTRPKAPVKAEQEVVATLSLGEIVSITALNEGWFWVPKHRGWVWQHQILPLDKAIEFFTTKIKEKPTSHAHHHRGLAWRALGDKDAAYADLSSAIALDSRNASALVNRGNLHRSRGEVDKAIADYSAALLVEPKNVQAFNNRGLAWGDREDWTRATRDLNRALHFNSEFADAYNNRGVVRRMQGDLVNALADYDLAIKFDPQHAEAHANRGYVRKQQREFAKALADYKTSLQLNPTASNVLNDMAWLLATCSDKKFRDGQKAIEHSLRACELADPDANMFDTLAAAYAEGADFDQAVKWGTKAVRLAKPKDRAELKSRLKLYQSKQAYHSPAN